MGQVPEDTATVKPKSIELIEQGVQAVIANQLQRIGPLFSERGIRVEVKPIVKLGSGDQDESEVCIYFWRGPELRDALEFHIARGGEIVADAAAVEEWFQQQINGVLGKL